MNLRMIRREKMITQQQLADAVGVSQAYICSLESGKRLNPSLQLLIKISDVLRVPLEHLVNENQKAV